MKLIWDYNHCSIPHVPKLTGWFSALLCCHQGSWGSRDILRRNVVIPETSPRTQVKQLLASLVEIGDCKYSRYYVQQLYNYEVHVTQSTWSSVGSNPSLAAEKPFLIRLPINSPKDPIRDKLKTGQKPASLSITTAKLNVKSQLQY